MGTATSVAARKGAEVLEELEEAGPTREASWESTSQRLRLLEATLDTSPDFLEAVAHEAEPVRAILGEISHEAAEAVPLAPARARETKVALQRRRVSELLERDDTAGLEVLLQSMKISDALYASVMAGVRAVSSLSRWGGGKAGASAATLELQLLKEKLAKLEDAHAKLAEENSRLRVQASTGSVRDGSDDRESLMRATFLKSRAGTAPYGSVDPAAVRDPRGTTAGDSTSLQRERVSTPSFPKKKRRFETAPRDDRSSQKNQPKRGATDRERSLANMSRPRAAAQVRDWLQRVVTPLGENETERQRFDVIAEALFASGADGPALLERCAARVGKPPFFEVRFTKDGKKLDMVKLVSLKRFNIVLNEASGFGFYCLLYRSCHHLGPLQDFEWVRKLGQGGQGVVHLCANRYSGDLRAVKLVHVGEDLERAALEMEFQQVASALEATKVVRLETWGQIEEEYLFAVMEHAAGGELRARLRAGVGVEDGTTYWKWVAQLADAVAELHSRNLVHRDLKPENVLLTSGDDVRLADLGLARAVSDAPVEVSMTVAGTLNYMAPELLAGKRASAKADSWSLAVIFFEMRTGPLPVHDDGARGDALDEYEARPGAAAIDDETKAFLRFVLVRDVALRPTSAEIAAYLRDHAHCPSLRALWASPESQGKEGSSSSSEEALAAKAAPEAPAAGEDATAAVVVDLGSAFVKFGLSTDRAARTCRTIVGRPKVVKDESLSGLDGATRKFYVGDDAVNKRGVLDLVQPIVRGLVVDWDSAATAFLHLFASELKVDATRHPLLLAESPLNPKANRERMTSLLFETLDVPLLYVNAQAVLSLYASGRTTGCVLDVGDDRTHAVPVFAGYAVPHAIMELQATGKDLTDHVVELSKTRYGLDVDREVAADIKERLSYVALCYQSELMTPSEVFERHYELPDGTDIVVGSERFMCPEILFDPERFGKAHQGGVQDIIHAAICKCDPKIVPELCANVVLSGGTTMLPGFPERLTKELLIKRETMEGHPKVKIKIFAPPDRARSVWVGGMLLACLPSFPSLCVSRKEFDDHGPACVHRLLTIPRPPPRRRTDPGDEAPE